MFPGSTEFKVPVLDTITIHGIRFGSGPPLLLLHGFPQTHHIWHKVAPELSKTYTVIAPDLRGYGKSSKPPSTASENHRPYAKSTMAADAVTVMEKLGFEKFKVVGHDRGGRVAHKLATDFPERVEGLMVLDIAPTLAMFQQVDRDFATAYWHWFFLIQPEPFPENVISNSPAWFKTGFLGRQGFMDDAAIETYVAQFTDREGVHAMCEDYRAAATIDLQEAKDDLEAGKKIKCPMRVLWGNKGVVEKKFDALKEWREVCDGQVSGEPVPSGHYIPEEVPEILLKHIMEFFG